MTKYIEKKQWEYLYTGLQHVVFVYELEVNKNLVQISQ